MAKVDTDKCEGCKQDSPLGEKHPPVKGHKCCPPGCQLCNKKKCKEQKKCKCNECNCGCQLEENKGKLCKDLGCPLCVFLCKDVKAGGKCLCSKCTCGCEKAFEEGKLCYESNHNKKCNDCTKKCGKSIDGTCICQLCSCGCDGVNCQCCIRCNPVTTCPGKGKCDSVEKHDKTTCPKGMCEKTPGSCNTLKCQCTKMGISLKRKDVCECLCKCGGRCPRAVCASKKSEGSNYQSGNCTGPKGTCNCECKCTCNAYGIYYNKSGNKVDICSTDEIHVYTIGKCRFPCTNCGRLCDQDRCMNWIRVIVIGLIILASLFVLRAIFPEKFRAIMTKIRATFVSAPVHAGRSLNNLVGDKIPEEMNIDRYPAISPGTFAGLS